MPSHCSGTGAPIASIMVGRMSTFSVKRLTRAPRAAPGRGSRTISGMRYDLVEVAALVHQPVVAELLAVVAGEDDQRALPEPASPSGSRRAGRSRRPRGSSARSRPPSGAAAASRRRARESRGASAARRARDAAWPSSAGAGGAAEAGDLGRVVHGVVGPRRDERRVRAQQREVGDERTLGRASGTRSAGRSGRRRRRPRPGRPAAAAPARRPPSRDPARASHRPRCGVAGTA